MEFTSAQSLKAFFIPSLAQNPRSGQTCKYVRVHTSLPSLPLPLPSPPLPSPPSLFPAVLPSVPPPVHPFGDLEPQGPNLFFSSEQAGGNINSERAHSTHGAYGATLVSINRTLVHPCARTRAHVRAYMRAQAHTCNTYRFFLKWMLFVMS